MIWKHEHQEFVFERERPPTVSEPLPSRIVPTAPKSRDIRPSLQLYSLHHRLVRQPLLQWAENLLAEMSSANECDCRSASYFATATEWSNATALIQAHAGELDMAAETCLATLRWLAPQVAVQSGEPHARLPIQPWINLGRLQGMRHRPALALEHFEVLRQYFDKQPLLLGPVTIPAGRSGIDSSDPGLVQLIYGTYVIDSLKTLLLNHRFAQVLQFIDHCETPSGVDFHSFLREARLIALTYLQLDEKIVDEDLLDTARTAHSTAHSWERIVFRLRWAEIAAAVGHSSDALRIVTPLLKVCDDLCRVHTPNLSALLVAQRVVMLFSSLGDSANSLHLGMVLMDGAQRTNDEIMVAELLAHLCEIAPDSESGALRARLEELRRRTCYVRLRRSTEPSPAGAVSAKLAERLCEVMS